MNENQRIRLLSTKKITFVHLTYFAGTFTDILNHNIQHILVFLFFFILHYEGRKPTDSSSVYGNVIREN